MKQDIPLRLYNSATRDIEVFKPVQAGKVGLYACGPTVYHYAHIGNMRTYVFEDVLTRSLRAFGYDVKHVMNITDVGHLQSDADEGEDKMAIAAKREAKSPWDIARYYEEAFFKHSAMLNIKRPDIVCRATEHIDEMIEMVQTLIDKGYAYEAGGNVYFEVSKYAGYADFARLKMDDQQATDRVEHDARKRNQADFALWFGQSKFPNQIMKWDSPWGVGFPGWHIECSAMAMKYLGERIDIHCGGIDHIPVHHTNEIAQSQCCIGHDQHQWVNYWMHGAFLTVDSDKMSKSTGDFLTVDTVYEAGFHPLAYRYFILTSHYRNALNFNYDMLAQAQEAYSGLYQKMQELRQIQGDNALPELSDTAQNYARIFWESLGDDLKTSAAMAAVWNAARDETLPAGERLALLGEFDSVLGLHLSGAVPALSNDEAALMAERQAARDNKNWAESDRLRDVLVDMGLQVKDSKDGTQWVRILPPVQLS